MLLGLFDERGVDRGEEGRGVRLGEAAVVDEPAPDESIDLEFR